MCYFSLQELEARIKEVQSKIDQNKHLKEKAIELRQILKDRNAQLQCETQIKESQRYIDYFTEELRRLQTRGSRASFISMQSSVVDSPESGITSLPMVDSPEQSLNSYFTNVVEEEDPRRRYTNLGKNQINIG